MAFPVDFKGSNLILNASPGTKHNVNSGLPAFRNRVAVITCWELTPEELREILSTGKLYLSIMGQSQPPLYVGSEQSVRDVNADYGLWKKE